jgi:hypothetical protein
MKTLLMLAAFCLLIVAGCESNDGPAGPVGDDGSGVTEAGDIVTQQDRDVCEWFAKLIEDVNVGEVRGTASAEGGAVGETRYRINNMYGLSLGAHEPIPTAVNNLAAKTRGSFEFEDVREEVNALRDACAQLGLPVPELQ